MTYTLYGDKGSGSCIVEAALAEIGTNYATEDINLGADEQRGSAYARINPQRKLPALVTPAGEVLTESMAILLTLMERHPHHALLPDAASARAQALRWLAYVAGELYPIIEINDYPERFTTDSSCVSGVRKRAKEIWRERWLMVESNSSGDPYLLPSGFCVTDIYIAVVSRWAQQADWRPRHIPRIESLTAATAARPAIAPVWARHFG
jgi:glutathione S-transferase